MEKTREEKLVTWLFPGPLDLTLYGAVVKWNWEE